MLLPSLSCQAQINRHTVQSYGPRFPTQLWYYISQIRLKLLLAMIQAHVLAVLLASGSLHPAVGAGVQPVNLFQIRA